MRIIKLDAIDSTNTYLKQISVSEVLDDYTVVTTKNQTNGRGQRGTVWNSEKAKNLTCSVFKKGLDLAANEQFYVSIVTSLAVVKTLKSLNIPKLHVKWPNDILSENKKVCGILIENVIKNNNLVESIIGIGLNVNQARFVQLPNASSLKNLTGTVFNLDELLQLIITNLKYYFKYLNSGEFEFLKAQYEQRLFRKDKPSSFKNAQGNIFAGFIKGINSAGNLQILLEDDILMEYDLKEITLLY